MEIAPHAHKNYELHYIDEGEGQITLGNSTCNVCSGQGNEGILH